MREVLLIGTFYQGIWLLPDLLRRAGFIVDVITTARVLRYSRLIRNLTIVSSVEEVIKTALSMADHCYELIVVTDDNVLKAIVESPLSPEDKLKLLSICGEENLPHIFSRVGLAKTLFSQGVRTPAFRVVSSLAEARVAAQEIGFPVMLKTDFSGNGTGIFECQCDQDIEKAPEEIYHTLFLVQKKIIGRELDLSAIYFEGELIHFAHAEVLEVTHLYGPSKLRRYTPLSLIPQELFEEVAALGRAIGAHGFVSVTCMESEEGRFFIEADMRPNVWVNFSRYYGEDPASRIALWFDEKKGISYPVTSSTGPLVLPFFLRMSAKEILTNQHNVLKYIPLVDTLLLARILFEYLAPRLMPNRLPITKSLRWHKLKGKMRKLRTLISSH